MVTHSVVRRYTAIVAVAGVILVFPCAGIARDYTPAECPVVANTESGIYHTRSSMNYRMMLQENKDKRRKDNRKCFKTELEAKTAGYRKAK